MKIFTRILCALCLICFVACSKEDPVIVSVGASKLYLSDVQKMAPEWDSWNDQQRLKFLEHWIDDETVYQEAIENGIENDSNLSLQIEQTVRKMVVDHFLQSFADTMMVSDAEKNDFYRGHSELFLRGKTMVSGALIFFKDWQAADLYYKGHKNLTYDSIPAAHYLVKKIERFDSLTTTPDSCTVPNINTVTLGKISPMKYCGGSLKIAVVTSRLDSADVLPFDDVAEEVTNMVWLEHRASVMERLRKEWKMKRPIFSQTNVFSEKDK